MKFDATIGFINANKFADSETESMFATEYETETLYDQPYEADEYRELNFE